MPCIDEGLVNEAARKGDSCGASRVCATSVADAAASARSTPTIAIVDDQPLNIKIVTKYLRLAGFAEFRTTTDSREALDMVRRERPDVLLLDLIMPHVDGLEILGHLRREKAFAHLPIIMVTASHETETRVAALRLGATEFLPKPVDPTELQVRVGNALLLKAHFDHLQSHAATLAQEVASRTAELLKAHREVVQCLAVAGEYRDNETGHHILRVGDYAEIIAQHLGMGAAFTVQLREAAPLHDIGKVAIPDSVLLKPGKLDAAEFALMQRHCEYGRNICSRRHHTSGAAVNHMGVEEAKGSVASSPVMQMAAVIAHTHHERWDGRGYPRGLRGTEIPIEGRITALADVFDAVTSTRPYKPAFPLDDALDIIAQGRGTQFDPAVVDAFFAGLEQVLETYYELNPDASASATGPATPTWLASHI